jgi:hypothetical protein
MKSPFMRQAIALLVVFVGSSRGYTRTLRGPFIRMLKVPRAVRRSPIRPPTKCGKLAGSETRSPSL